MKRLPLCPAILADVFTPVRWLGCALLALTKLGIPRLTTAALAALAILADSALAQNGGVVTAVNISARATVSSGANVLIGGFIVTGSSAKPVLLRALGPSLNVGGAPS